MRPHSLSTKVNQTPFTLIDWHGRLGIRVSIQITKVEIVTLGCWLLAICDSSSPFVLQENTSECGRGLSLKSSFGIILFFQFTQKLILIWLITSDSILICPLSLPTLTFYRMCHVYLFYSSSARLLQYHTVYGTEWSHPQLYSKLWFNHNPLVSLI